MVLRAFVHRDRDDVAGRVVLIGDVGVGDAEIRVAVLHVIFADRLLVGGEAIGIVNVAVLKPREEIHLGRLHQPVQAIGRNGVVADEFDFAHAGLVAFVDLEDEIDAPVGQLHQAIADLRGAAADLLIGVPDAIDVALGLRVVEAGARLGLDFDRELVALERFVALERHAIDDLRALDDSDDHLAADDLRAHLGKHAGRRQVRDGAIDARLVRAGEIGTNRGRVSVARALDDDSLSGNLRRRRPANPGRAPGQSDREEERAKITTKQMHLARCPRFATEPNGLGPWRPRLAARHVSWPLRASPGSSRVCPQPGEQLLNWLLPVLRAGANSNSGELTPIRRTVAGAPQFMVDLGLIAGADEPQNVVRGRENHQ